MTKNTPRQPVRSPTTPASDEPSRFPVITAASQRPIAIWRSFTGTRSPITAMPTGKMPPPAMPATMRAPSSIEKSVASPLTSIVTIVTARHAIITRTLPTMSPTGPITGCESANGSANAVVSSATAFGSTWMSWAICGMTGSVARDASAVMNPIRLSRRMRLLVCRSSRLGGDGGRGSASSAAESNLGWKFMISRRAIHDFRRVCCAVRECLTQR